MIIVVPRETEAGETRVALVPDVVGRLVKAGHEVRVEADAGVAASYSNEQYTLAGARVLKDRAALLAGAKVVVKVQKPSMDEVERLPRGCMLISFLYPMVNLRLVQALAERGVTCMAMDAIPRISRAQVMDALSSMSTVAGYKAVLLAAARSGRFFPMLTTAAGTIAPARVFILGAGVAGLQAIATARRLGGVVEAFDVRPAVKEQVESLGARFVEMELPAGTEDAGGYAREQSEDFLRREMEAIHRHAREADVIITTALIPGKPAPILLTEAMVDDMKRGSIIIDLAAEMGGNCALTKPGEDIDHRGVLISGVLNLPASMPIHASQMYSRNVLSLLTHLIDKEKQLILDFTDEITRGTCITHEGQVNHAPTRTLLEAVPA